MGKGAHIMRILAVDDDRIILDLLTVALSAFGYDDVVTAENGVEAMEILQGDDGIFDTLLYDIQMPVMDGIELVSRTRALPRYKDVPILMLTAMSEKTYIDRAFLAGATDYITKPFDTMELQSRLKVARLLAGEQKTSTEKVFAAKIIRDKTADRLSHRGEHQIPLEEAYPVQDMDCVISLAAFENYVQQLGRGSFFGTSIMAFKIEGIERLYANLTDYEYTCLITDTVEALSTALNFMPQYLLTYFGNGTFLCSSDKMKSMQLRDLPTSIHYALDAMDLRYGDGRSMMITVKVGMQVQSRCKTDASVGNTIRAAVENVALRPVVEHTDPDTEFRAQFFR